MSTKISAASVANALQRLHTRHDLDENQAFSAKEIVEEITGNPPEEENAPEYRAFVSAVRAIHADPARHLPLAFDDIIRLEYDAGFQGWGFRLVREDQIGEVYEYSGFENRDLECHRENKLNFGKWPHYS